MIKVKRYIVLAGLKYHPRKWTENYEHEFDELIEACEHANQLLHGFEFYFDWFEVIDLKTKTIVESIFFVIVFLAYRFLLLSVVLSPAFLLLLSFFVNFPCWRSNNYLTLIVLVTETLNVLISIICSSLLTFISSALTEL